MINDQLTLPLSPLLRGAALVDATLEAGTYGGEASQSLLQGFHLALHLVILLL